MRNIAGGKGLPFPHGRNATLAPSGPRPPGTRPAAGSVFTFRGLAPRRNAALVGVPPSTELRIAPKPPG
jgi:hypothetical protein